MPDRPVSSSSTTRRRCAQAVTQWLELAGFELIVHDNATSALGKLSADFPGVLVTDLKMEGIDGMELLRRSHADRSRIARGRHHRPRRRRDRRRGDAARRLRLHREAVRAGALPRGRAPRRREAPARDREPAAAPRRQRADAELAHHRHLARRGRLCAPPSPNSPAPTSASILYGETGVGKDLVARCLHDFGRRHEGNYVAVNCAAMPDTMVESEFFGHEAGAFTSAVKTRAGKLEHASGGTLFLDEIDSMPLGTQGKLLRVLQERVGRAPRLEPQHHGRLAAARGEQDRSAQGERRGPLPRRSLLPPFGGRADGAAAARAQGGHPAAVRIFRGARRAGAWPRAAARSRRPR